MRLLFSVAVLVAAVTASACGSDDNPTGPSNPSVGLNVPFSATDIVVGSGTEAISGRSATVQYTGWLYYPNVAENKGPSFDSGTFTFVVGSGVIEGFSRGVQGMRVGGARRVVIPPAMGYGVAGNGPVPGNATILFEITLLNVQ